MPNGYDPSNFPTSFTDPAYEQADQKAAAAAGIPVAMLSNIRTKGERTNADKISSAKAATPYQITPDTRQSIIDQTGVDPYSNPQAAAYGAAYLLKQSMSRNGGDPVKAVAEYAGGTDPSNWGPRTMAYVKRVTGYTPNSYQHGESANPYALQSTPDVGQAPGSIGAAASPVQPGEDPYHLMPSPQVGSAPGAISPTQNALSALTQVYQAYSGGKMDPADAAQFEQDVNAGRIVLPAGMNVKAPEAQPPIIPIAPQAAVQAFNSGQMPAAEAAQFQRDVNSNAIALPPGAQLTPPAPSAKSTAGVAARGYLEGLGSSAGSLVDKAAGAIDAPMRLVNAISGGVGPLQALDSLVGTHLSTAAPASQSPNAIAPNAPNAGAVMPNMEQAPVELANHLNLPQAQTPGQQIVQAAARGAGAMTTPIPGESGVANLLKWIGAGAVGGGVGEKVAQATGSQGLGAIANLVTTAFAPAAASRIMGAFFRELPQEAAAGIKPSTVEAPAAGPTEAGTAAEPAPATATQAAPAEAQAQDAMQAATQRAAAERGAAQAPAAEGAPAGAATPEAAPAESAAPAAPQEAQAPQSPQAAAAQPTATNAGAPMATVDERGQDLVALARKATGADGTTDQAARQAAAADLAQRMQLDPEAVQAARDLGMEADVQPAHLSTNMQVIQLDQLAKSVPGSSAYKAEVEGLTRVGQKAMGLLDQVGATQDLSTLSGSVKNDLLGTIERLKQRETMIYQKELWNEVPKQTEAQAPAAIQMIEQVASELGGTQHLPKELKMVLARITPVEEGMSIGGQQLTAEEARQIGLSPSMKGPTLGLVDQTRRDVGAAIEQRSGPFANADTELLGRLYWALSKDEENAFAAHGVDSLWQEGKQTTQLRKSIEADTVHLFGRDLQGSLVPRMEAAMKGLPSGNMAGFEKMVKAVPDSMRQEVVASALRRTFEQGGKGQFGPMNFQAFDRFWKGLQKNSSAYSAVMANLPEDTRTQLSQFSKVAARIAKSTGEQIRTGRSQFAQEFMAPADKVSNRLIDAAKTKIGNVVAHSAVNVGARVGSTVAGATIGGPMGAAVGSAVGDTLGGYLSRLAGGEKTPAMDALNQLLVSPELTKLLTEAAAPADQTIKQAANSSAFRRFWSTVKAPTAANDPTTRERWLRAAVNAAGESRASNNNNQGSQQ